MHGAAVLPSNCGTKCKSTFLKPHWPQEGTALNRKLGQQKGFKANEWINENFRFLRFPTNLKGAKLAKLSGSACL